MRLRLFRLPNDCLINQNVCEPNYFPLNEGAVYDGFQRNRVIGHIAARACITVRSSSDLSQLTEQFICSSLAVAFVCFRDFPKLFIVVSAHPFI